jgi:acyl-coenzyme A synthetase/AMP-(fatty) acid ligase
MPEEIVFLDDLPRNVVRKVHRHTLRTTYLAGSDKVAVNGGAR